MDTFWKYLMTAVILGTTATAFADTALEIEGARERLDQQRRFITAKLLQAEENEIAERQRQAERVQNTALPAGLVVLAPPVIDGGELYTIQCEEVSFKNILSVFARRAHLEVRTDAAIDNIILNQRLTVDLRNTSIEDAIEYLAGVVGVDYELGYIGQSVRQVLFTVQKHERLAEKKLALQRSASGAYTRFLLKYPEHPFTAHAQFHIAQIDFEQGEYALAAQEYLLLLDNKNVGDFKEDALYNLGWCYANVGDHEAAVNTFHRFLRLDPDHERVATTLLALARVHTKAGQDEQAVQRYRQLLLDHPTSSLVPAAQFELAEVLYANEEYGAAQRQYSLVRESVDTEMARQVAYRIAMCKMKQDQWQVAATDFARLITSNKQDTVAADSMYQLALCLENSGSLLERVEAYVGAVQHAPDHPSAMAARTRVVALYREIGLIESAVNYGQATLKSMPEGAKMRELQAELAMALFESNKLEAAQRMFEELAQDEGEGISRAEALVYAGETARKLQQYDRAQVLYRGAVKAEPTPDELRRAFLGLGDTYLAAGHFDKAAMAYKGHDPQENQQ